MAMTAAERLGIMKKFDEWRECVAGAIAIILMAAALICGASVTAPGNSTMGAVMRGVAALVQLLLAFACGCIADDEMYDALCEWADERRERRSIRNASRRIRRVSAKLQRLGRRQNQHKTGLQKIGLQKIGLRENELHKIGLQENVNMLNCGGSGCVNGGNANGAMPNRGGGGCVNGGNANGAMPNRGGGGCVNGGNANGAMPNRGGGGCVNDRKTTGEMTRGKHTVNTLADMQNAAGDMYNYDSGMSDRELMDGIRKMHDGKLSSHSGSGTASAVPTKYER